jgi:hypothetical protein
METKSTVFKKSCMTCKVANICGVYDAKLDLSNVCCNKYKPTKQAIMQNKWGKETTTFEDRKIIITTNPDELRRLADLMEEKFPKIPLGKSSFIDFLAVTPEYKVCIHADQEWFWYRKQSKKKKSLYCRIMDCFFSHFEV